MDLLKEVKEELEITDTSQDKKIQGYIDEITNKVKSICNRADFPKELNYLAIRYAKNCYFYYKDKDLSKNENIQVKSATDGSQKVEFEKTENISKSDVDIDRVVAKNQDEISMYAYMRW